MRRIPSSHPTSPLDLRLHRHRQQHHEAAGGGCGERTAARAREPAGVHSHREEPPERRQHDPERQDRGDRRGGAHPGQRGARGRRRAAGGGGHGRHPAGLQPRGAARRGLRGRRHAAERPLGRGGGAARLRGRHAHPAPGVRRAPSRCWTWAADRARSPSASRTGSMGWSASFRIGSGFLADSYLRSDPPSVEELEKVRRHVAGAFEGLEPPPADSAVAVGGTATSLRRLVGAELAHETLERGIRVLSTTPIAGGRRALRARSRAGAAAAGRHPRARGDVRPARAAAAHRARRPARGRAARAGGGQEACLGDRRAARRSRASSDGRRSTLSSPLSTPASPPFFMPHLRAGERVHGRREVGIVAHEEHVVAEPGGQLVRVERPARQLRLELQLDVRAARTRAGRCRPRAPSDWSGRRPASRPAPERGPGRARLLAALLGQRPLGVRRSVCRLSVPAVARSPDQDDNH